MTDANKALDRLKRKLASADYDLFRTKVDLWTAQYTVQFYQDKAAELAAQLDQRNALLAQVTEQARRDTEELHDQLDALKKNFHYELSLKEQHRKAEESRKRPRSRSCSE